MQWILSRARLTRQWGRGCSQSSQSRSCRSIASSALAEQGAFTQADRRIDGYALPASEEGERFIVVSTQSRGDEAALMAALSTDARYVAFVGSRLKAQTLKAALSARGVDGRRLAALRAPAGLDLGAIGPEEIALSIIAEIVAFRRGPSTLPSPLVG